MQNPAGRRVVHVAPQRLAGWLDGFAERHGPPETTQSDGFLFLDSPDGARARIRLAWGPLPGADPLAEVVAESLRPRVVAGLIVRRRAHAVGIFDGEALRTGRHHGHYVQGRTKAGGWSQQRYARRRANQARAAYADAVDDAAEILVPALGEFEALATAGDRAAIGQVLAEGAVAGLTALPRLVVDGVGDPNGSVLAGFGARLREVWIELNDLA